VTGSRRAGRRDLLASVVVGRSVRRCHLPAVAVWRWVPAVATGARLARSFARSGAAGAAAGLPRPAPPDAAGAAPDLAWLEARRQADRLRRLLRTLRFLPRSGACYAHSFALAGALRVLGHDADVVVGVARVHLGAPTGFHAWVEVAAQPVSDPLEVASVFEPVRRYGAR
jgi:hypothetical protein